MIRAKDVYDIKNTKILKEIDPICVSKKFRSYECQLCIEKRIQIAKAKLFKTFI